MPVERLLVTDKQQPQVAKLLPLFPLRALRSPHLDRQPEDAAFSGLGFDVNLATHHIDEALCDRKAKAGSAITARHAAVSLREGSEKFFSRRGQDADTGIGDLDPQRVRHAALASEREAQANASLFRELDGIRKQVVEDLPVARRIPDYVVGHVVSDFELEIQSLV